LVGTSRQGRSDGRTVEPEVQPDVESCLKKGVTAVPHLRRSPERLSAFSDTVFAVLIAALVLELRPPELPTFQALLSLWPTWLSYAVSYLFIAIVWANHHHLMRYATEATPRLMWFNFAHLFSVSLLPLSTAWMAARRLAPQPVAFYAAVFFLVNATYFSFIWELIERDPAKDISPKERRIMRLRSIAVVALKYPLVGFGMCRCCLIIYRKPEAPEPRSNKFALHEDQHLRLASAAPCANHDDFAI
jgi:uncharacterized membrane protein